MGFEVFDSYGAAARSEASLRASGYLFIPRSLGLQVGIDAAHKQLVLLIDDGARKIAVRAPNDADSAGAKRDVSHEQSGFAVNILPLMKRLRIEKRNKKIALPVEARDGMLIVDMSSAVTGAAA